MGVYGVFGLRTSGLGDAVWGVQDVGIEVPIPAVYLTGSKPNFSTFGLLIR